MLTLIRMLLSQKRKTGVTGKDVDKVELSRPLGMEMVSSLQKTLKWNFHRMQQPPPWYLPERIEMRVLTRGLFTQVHSSLSPVILGIETTGNSRIIL